MGRLDDAKLLGGIGSILIILSLIPYAGVVIGIVGLVLVLIAVKYISDYLKDRSIFNNMLISVILSIVGTAVISYLLLLWFIMGSLLGFGSVIQGAAASDFFTSTLIAILLGIVVIWIFLLVSALFIRRSYGAIANKLGISLFNTVSLLYIIGAALTIVLIGFIIVFVAVILQAVAFFSIEEPRLDEAPKVPE
ncbi:MAG TPA: DUF996 domain-containing protein [Candidatus Caldiarchaeum subterraneum]|uniref:DUF996 domain-containing protein n=1 Tax=Caldiarchaeum subterraneum TaxID=311458 RepID=A0A832ZV61_CALS0|nr:DUF996 domain-containing protein [Candidatus Caldarchaeum subterraneum]